MSDRPFTRMQGRAMFIKQLHLTNLLSFGPEAEPVELGPLNVLIGPNGSGKSNFLEALALLQAAPDQIARPIRNGGGVLDWLYQGEGGLRADEARLEAVFEMTVGEEPAKDFRYGIAFREEQNRFALCDEFLENSSISENTGPTDSYYKLINGKPHLLATNSALVRAMTGNLSGLLPTEFASKPDLSGLAQFRGDQYRTITQLAEEFASIRLYREWTFGRNAAPRSWQKADLPTDGLLPDASNLALMLNKIRRGKTYRHVTDALKRVYEGIEDFDVQIEGGSVRVFLREDNGAIIPATRLSDGTLRYLALLTILCDPTPPPLIAIDEPELGLHPDLLHSLARMLVEASTRTQLVVTTHAVNLVDALTEHPEAILVCERDADGTHIERLSKEEMAPWLEKYRLGELWTSGEIGGTRW